MRNIAENDNSKIYIMNKTNIVDKANIRYF